MNLIMGMFTAMAALIVGSIWNQHRESANARAEYRRDLERATDKLSAEFNNLKETEFNEGGNHEIWRLGSERLVIPRHRETNERTAAGILAEAGRLTGDGG